MWCVQPPHPTLCLALPCPAHRMECWCLLSSHDRGSLVMKMYSDGGEWLTREEGEEGGATEA